MPLGRPTKYREEYCEQAIEFMAQGFSKEALAGHLRITKQTLYNWMESHPTFFDAIKHGEQLSRAFWEKMGIDGARGEIPGFNATAWVFNMKNRVGWRDKTEVTGEGGGPIKTESKMIQVVGVKPDENPDP